MVPMQRLELQWLRAIAAIEVVLCHSDLVTKHFSNSLLSLTGYPEIGGLGVEIFFVLSGYLMATRIASYRDGWTFIKARCLRLVPMYWIFTSLVLLAIAINPSWRLNGVSTTPSVVIRSYLILPQDGFPVLGVGWSLEHEMIFYALIGLSLLIWYPKQQPREAFAWLLALLGWTGAALNIDPGGGSWFTHPLSVLMITFAFGWLYRCLELVKFSGGTWKIGMFLLITVLVFQFADAPNANKITRAMIAIGLFVAFVELWRSPSGRQEGTAPRVFAAIGDASYSIYLSHWFILSLIGKGLGAVGLAAWAAVPIRLAAIGVCVAIGYTFYLCLERPLDRWVRARRPFREAFGRALP